MDLRFPLYTFVFVIRMDYCSGWIYEVERMAYMVVYPCIYYCLWLLVTVASKAN